MKKKSQKFTSFVSRTQYVNYRDTLEIVNGFNHSVRLYKRFKSVLSGGDDQLAARKLREAGTALFQVCEWALKNYLHKRYMEMEKEGIMTPNLRQVKIDNLQARTTNLITLMDEFEENSSPAFQSLGIKLQYILSAADEVNNKPKHNAAVPDPTKYQKALNEIRKIINNYVDSNAKLDLLDDTVFGEEKRGMKLWKQHLIFQMHIHIF